MLIERVESWKSNCDPWSEDQLSVALSLNGTFNGFAPYFFTMKDTCFFRSLALLKYLSLYRMSADWVFGVRLSPFSAHCWIQCGQVVLNERLDNVLNYTPIMRI